MKNQYVGDINDYTKYILLEKLSSVGLRIGICWMLTENNNRTDGGRISYLNMPPYRVHNPVIYDALKSIVLSDRRNVTEIQAANIIPESIYYNHLDDMVSNESIDLMFFDPDNGFEVKSVAKGKAGSERYVFWGDVVETYDSGYSVMVYQHFPRVNRNNYMDSLSFKVVDYVRAKVVCHIYTSTVDFVLIPQPKHYQLIEGVIEKLRNANKGLVKVKGIREGL